MADLERAATRVKGFDDPEMDFQLLRSLSNCDYGGAAPGQVLALAQGMGEVSPAAWTASFASLGRETCEDGERRSLAGHKVSARDQFLRACEYFRAAEYFADPLDPERGRLGLASAKCFQAHAELMPFDCEALNIPFEGTDLPGYFLTPQGGGEPGPTLVVVSGFDGTCEESYLQLGRAGLERGMNVMLFAGPGQADTRRANLDSVFRPDFEAPIAAALGVALSKPQTDPVRLALAGISFGGYFTMRAAAHDARIKALVSNSPISDLAAYMFAFMGGEQNARASGDATFDEIVSLGPDEFPPLLRWQLLSSMARFGQKSFFDWLETLKKYRVDPAKIEKIACPCLALVGEGEGAEPLRQAREFAETVANAKFRLFTAREGADAHCQVGNSRLGAAVIFDWLEEVLG